MPTIDVHAHYLPEDCRDTMDYADNATYSGDLTDIDRRLRDMDAAAVDIQVLSPSAQFANHGLDIARRYNNSMADAAHKHPDRFIGMALVPLREPDQAPAELERAVKELGLQGVEIASNVLGTNLDAKEFGPFYAKAQELDVPIFIHPLPNVGKDRMSSHHLDFLLGNPTDTAVAVGSLIFGGVLKEFPRLKPYLAHGGGTCPYLRGRWDQGWRLYPDLRGLTDQSPSECLKRFRYDALVYREEALHYLVELVGADHVMVGTDYPYALGDREQVERIRGMSFLSEGERELVLSGTASALFKLGE